MDASDRETTPAEDRATVERSSERELGLGLRGDA